MHKICRICQKCSKYAFLVKNWQKMHLHMKICILHKIQSFDMMLFIIFLIHLLELFMFFFKYFNKRCKYNTTLQIKRCKCTMCSRFLCNFSYLLSLEGFFFFFNFRSRFIERFAIYLFEYFKLYKIKAKHMNYSI